MSNATLFSGWQKLKSYMSQETIGNLEDVNSKLTLNKWLLDGTKDSSRNYSCSVGNTLPSITMVSWPTEARWPAGSWM
jgi:hypothetical protein